MLARIRQENRRTWRLLASGKTGEQKNMGIACGDKTKEHENMGLLARIRQKNRRTCSLVEVEG